MDPDGPKTALKALIKYLQQSAAKDPKTAAFTLTLLDMCVKNCGYPFLLEFCRGDYLKNLKNLVWGLAFSNHADFQPFNALYQALLHKSFRFPDVETNDVELLRRTFPPLGSTQRTATPSGKDTHLLIIRRDLHFQSLDLQDLEGLFQTFTRNPSDNIARIRLRNAAVRLQGYQKILEADVLLLEESKYLQSESILEEQITLNELIRVIDKIGHVIQQFQSLEKMRYQEEEEVIHF
ncbi:unnamed protein product [Dibothriocephalus latus]|uniref:VHS domain-containing protein n=1 Tax=Dibothriocephalus latus TaxID=60516 RepID=A0A3P7L4N9_DIBLA|nr:unnamed protein product [Dibothriocephalus latus]